MTSSVEITFRGVRMAELLTEMATLLAGQDGLLLAGKFAGGITIHDPLEPREDRAAVQVGSIQIPEPPPAAAAEPARRRGRPPKAAPLPAPADVPSTAAVPLPAAVEDPIVEEQIDLPELQAISSGAEDRVNPDDVVVVVPSVLDVQPLTHDDLRKVLKEWVTGADGQKIEDRYLKAFQLLHSYGVKKLPDLDVALIPEMLAKFEALKAEVVS